MKKSILAVLMIAVAVAAVPALADVKPASLFQDNAVLQQGMKVPVWGFAVPGEKVTVTFDGQSVSTTTDKDGTWQVELGPLSAEQNQQPRTLTIAGNNTISLKNVLVGEVWICSGQSNMEWWMGNSNNGKQEVAESDYPEIRMFTVQKNPTAVPQKTCGGTWEVSSPETSGHFSAVGYFFARDLYRKLNIPIGMIHTSWGGTMAEPWTSIEKLKSMDIFRDRVLQYEQQVAEYNANKEEYQKKREEAIDAYGKAKQQWLDNVIADEVGTRQEWFVSSTSTADWKTCSVPMTGETLNAYLGMAWARKNIEIPAGWVGHDLKLDLGAIDDWDVTFVNGEAVGSDPRPNSWHEPRHYVIPAKLVTDTNLAIVVRMINIMGAVGLFGNEGQYSVVPADIADAQPISLAGTWLLKKGDPIDVGKMPRLNAPSIPGKNPQNFGALYNGMIVPLIPYAMRGAIWYQGESNAGRPEEYAELFPAMITCWREAWDQGDFPFYFVQLANFMSRQSQPVEQRGWADLRDAQTSTLSLPNTGMAVIIDIGEANDIHPRNKQDVGARLARWALARDYGYTQLEYSGPLYKSVKFENGKAILSFSHTGSGLVAHGKSLVGFAIAGPDRIFHAAQAEIQGESVVVSSDKVTDPQAVRYGWANNPICNLYNKEGLPASPFRTDTWDWKSARPGDEKLSEPVTE